MTKSTEDKPTCESCPFFDLIHREGDETKNVNGLIIYKQPCDHAVCRFNPPVAIVSHEAEAVRGGFPSVSANDWCGEHPRLQGERDVITHDPGF